MGVAFRCDTAHGRGHARALSADARRLLGAAGLARCELSVVLTDDPAIRALNRGYRGKDRATDVLSFSQLEQAEPAARPGSYRKGSLPQEVRSSGGPRVPDGTALGDVVISLDTARRQARSLGVTAAERLRALLIHGFLHVLGYDHERSLAEARRMGTLEREFARMLARAGGAPGRGQAGRTRAAR